MTKRRCENGKRRGCGEQLREGGDGRELELEVSMASVAGS